MLRKIEKVKWLGWVISMDEKIYIINDNVEVKEKYLKMSAEERNREIQKIIEEDAVKRNRLKYEMENS